MTNKTTVGPARWLAALLAAFMINAAAQAPQRLTLNFANTDIEAVARAMADFTGRTFIVDPRVKGTVTLNIDQPLTPDEHRRTPGAPLAHDAARGCCCL